MRYFDIAGPLHHEDEERHVLPRLRATGQAALADRLHAEHEALSATWRDCRDVLAAVRQGRWNPAVATRVRDGWRAFESRYEAHIALEEAVAFPGAAVGLEPESLAAMGDEMARRRRPATPAVAR
jgi:hemerythrin-like domain-containing protein